MEKQRNRSFIRVRWEVECKKRNQTKNSRLRREDEVEFSHQLSSASAPGYNINTTLVTSVLTLHRIGAEEKEFNCRFGVLCSNDVGLLDVHETKPSRVLYFDI